MSIYGDFFYNFSVYLSLLVYSKMIDKLRWTVKKGKRAEYFSKRVPNEQRVGITP